MRDDETPFHTMTLPYRGGDSFESASLEEVMRFVREAIDYEAANEVATRWAAYLAGAIPYPFGSMVAAEAIIAAAIGVTNE